MAGLLCERVTVVSDTLPKRNYEGMSVGDKDITWCMLKERQGMHTGFGYFGRIVCFGMLARRCRLPESRPLFL